MNYTDDIRQLLEHYLPHEGIQETGIPGLVVFRRDTPYQKRPQLYHPQIIILAQGKKKIFLGEKTFIYDSTRYFVQTVALPVVCEAIIEKQEPMLGLVIAIEPRLIGELLYEMEPHPPAVRKSTYRHL